MFPEYYDAMLLKQFRHLFINVAVKCYKLIIILKTVRWHLFEEIMKGYNTDCNTWIFIKFSL